MNVYRVVALLTGLALPLPGLTQAVYEWDMKRSSEMPQFVIERDLPGAGTLSAAELRNISRKSNEVLRKMGSGIEWVQSYVTGDKIYCVYRAESEDAIRRHARAGGFPANKISRVMTTIDPSTGN
jgi:Nickel responsive protein SCO4226-like